MSGLCEVFVIKQNESKVQIGNNVFLVQEIYFFKIL